MEIYLDNASTTKVDERVLEEVNNFCKNFYANASSQHYIGVKTREKIEKARKRIAELINAEAEEIIFTSGGTESNNFAIKGLCYKNPKKKHIITSVIEHPSVLETCKELEKQGYKIDYIGVDDDGIIKVKDIEKKISKDTLLVSIMHVNNEVGTIQPLKEIGEICKKKDVYFHSDCVQSFKKLEIDVNSMNLDLISVSGHKINALKGIGFLYVRLGTKIKEILNGGGQEFKLRSGTENTYGIISLAKAIELENNEERIRECRDYLIENLKKIRGTRINGSIEKRIYNNVNVSFYGIEGESLMLLLDEEGIIVSTGSACASTKLEESYVLRNLRSDTLYIHGSIRLSLGKDIDLEKCKFVVDKIKEKVEYLRKISPFKLEDIEDE